MSKFGEFLGETGGMDEVKPGGRNPFLGLGIHELEVNRCIAEKARAGWFYFVAEFKVLQSTDAATPPDSTVVFYLSFKDHPDLKKRNLLDFVMKGFGLTEAEAKKAIDEEHIWGTKQVLAGEKVKVVVTEQISPKTKKKYKDHRWLPLAA